MRQAFSRLELTVSLTTLPRWLVIPHPAILLTARRASFVRFVRSSADMGGSALMSARETQDCPCVECGGKRSATPLWLNPNKHCGLTKLRSVTKPPRSPRGKVTDRETNCPSGEPPRLSRFSQSGVAGSAPSRRTPYLCRPCVECGGKRSATPLWLNPNIRCGLTKVRSVTKPTRSPLGKGTARETHCPSWRPRDTPG